MKSVRAVLAALQRRAISKLYKLYIGRKNQDNPFKFGLYASIYQLLAALTDAYYLTILFFGGLVSVFAGVAVSVDTGARIAIWGGAVTLTISVILGAILSSVMGDGFRVSKYVRLRIWLTTTLACVGATYFALKSLESFDWVWFLSCGILAVMLIIITEFYFEDRWHFLKFKQRLYDEKLSQRIPWEIRGKIIRMKAIDKYTHVLTEKGSVELRLSLSRAIDLCEESGFRVHRSYWVAEDYIQRPRKEGRKWYIEVEGDRIPVSETFYQDINGYSHFGYVPIDKTDTHSKRAKRETG